MDDSDFIEKSLKSNRELKCKPEDESTSKLIIASDYLLPGADKDQCFVCNKDLKCLDELRKSLHINHCLDQQEACNKYEAKKEKWKKVVDCPICGEPLEPGPFRAVHAKRCGKKHHVNPNSLLLLLDTQTKVAEAKKRNGIAHTKLKEPKLEEKKRPNRFNGEPRSLFDEQMKLTTALSASMCSSGSELYTETQEIPQKLHKTKCRKQRPRSFSFVEPEPRACKCEVIERIQENFLNLFKTRDEKQEMHTMLKKNIQNTEEILKNAGVCVRELNSLKQLAGDLAYFTESNSDVVVFARENETFLACRFIIAARAPTLLQHLDADGSLLLREYSGAAVKSYMTFLTSASIIWTENEREEVHSMAVKYGPEGLAALCKSAKLEVNSYQENVERCPEIHINGNCDDVEDISNKEKVEDIEVEGCCSDAKREICDDGKETKNANSDDPSIIFVEEVRGNAEIVEAARNMHSLLKETSENLSRPLESETLISEDNEIICGSRDLFRYSSPKCKKSLMDEKFGFLEKEIDELAKSNNSVLLGNKVDGAPLSSSPLPPCAASNVNAMDHLSDSIENLLKTLSPIKPLPSGDEKLLSPVAGCSRQTTIDNLFDNLSPEKLLNPPNFTFKSEETPLSRNSLIKTKSSPEFAFIQKKPSSLLLSTLPLLHRIPASPKNVSSSPERKRIRRTVFKRQTSTPEAPTSHLVRRFEELDSNVYILKTKDITPMPAYDLMNDKELKAELAKFGIRPMGKKRGVALLKRIYEETHPVLESTPLSRKIRNNRRMAEESGEHCSDEEHDTDKTLNRSLNEYDIMEESYMNEEQSAVLPKDLEGMQSVLLKWLRREENSGLYNRLLGLNVICFEEFANHLLHADSTVSQIPKKALIEILDRLHVTFRMPMDGWDRKRRLAKK